MEEKCEKHPAPPSMMIHEISKLFCDTINREVERLGIQNGYRFLLFMLRQEEGVTQYDLACKTHLKAPTVSVTLKNMEKDGLVRRASDETDARSIRVYLTDKGREAEQAIHDCHIRLDERMENGISKEDLASAMKTLTRIRDNLLMQDAKPQQKGNK